MQQKMRYLVSNRKSLTLLGLKPIYLYYIFIFTFRLYHSRYIER